MHIIIFFHSRSSGIRLLIVTFNHYHLSVWLVYNVILDSAGETVTNEETPLIDPGPATTGHGGSMFIIVAKYTSIT